MTENWILQKAFDNYEDALIDLHNTECKLASILDGDNLTQYKLTQDCWHQFLSAEAKMFASIIDGQDNIMVFLSKFKTDLINQRVNELKVYIVSLEKDELD